MSKDLKSYAFIEQHNLRESVKLNDANSFEIPADLYSDIVLGGSGITLDQMKKKDKLEGELLSAVTLVAGEQVAERFKENVELSEVGFTYGHGSYTASGIFSRQTDDAPASTVLTVNTKYTSPELKRVIAHTNQLFADINS